MKCLVNWIPLNMHVRFEQTPFLPSQLWTLERQVNASFFLLSFLGFEDLT